MKEYLRLFGFALMLFAAAGCESPTSEMIEPDADFYARGREAEKNGTPPGSSPGMDGQMKPSDGPSAISP